MSFFSGGNLSSVLLYKKPSQRPEPTFDPPVSVSELKPDNNTSTIRTAKVRELVYTLSRSGLFHDNCDKEAVLPWGNFHTKLSAGNKQPVSQVAYNPILMASPSDKSTIYTTLKRAKESINMLGHESAPVFFDMGLLTKALEITWSRPVDLAGIIPCDGGMHLLMSLFAGIGKLYGDAGLKNLLHESGVFAPETTNRMMLGKDFDRALYGLTLVYEVLSSRYLKHFLTWCLENGKQVPPEISNLLETFHQKSKEGNIQEISSIIAELAEPLENDLIPLLARFQEHGCASSSTFKFWDDFLNKVMMPLMLFLSSSKNGDWEVYQASKKWLLPLLFASGRSTYARYMPVILLSMDRLPPSLHEFFMAGHFMAKLSEGKFNKLWMDYCLETTQNKELKGSGGIIGLTMRGSALARWFIARPITAVYSRTFLKEMCRHETKLASREKSKAKRWNADVLKMEHLFDGTYVDPFDVTDPPSSLVNIATGAVVPKDIEVSLLGAHDKGTSMAETFVSERLEIHEGEEKPLKSFYDPMPRCNIKTMAEMNKTITIHDKRVTLKGEVMYLRLMAVNARKKMPIGRVMSFENAPVPLSLFSDDGAMVSCKKSDFMHKLEELLPEKITEIPPADAVLFDGHAIIQALQAPEKQVNMITFRDMASDFLSYVKSLCNQLIGANEQSQMHVIFYHYDPQSIKGQTRENRNRNRAATIHHIQIDGKIPTKWKKFLGKSENKERLAKCYACYIKDVSIGQLKDGQQLFVSGGPNFSTFCVGRSSAQDIPELQSTQEEADTRIILHSIAAAKQGAQRLVVCSPDTDVLVLLLHHFPSIGAKEVYFLTGRDGKHTSMKRFIAVHDLFQKMSIEQHNILLPVYCLTGCDTVISFYGHGKRATFKAMQQNASKFQELATLGSRHGISTNERASATRFVGSLYGNSNCRSLNSLRCEKAQSGASPKKLPPTDNSFSSHLLRTWGQLLVWREATVANPVACDIMHAGFEFKITTNSLEPIMMTQSAAAPELLNDLVCECTVSGCNEDCTCAINLQPCTAACVCKAQLPEDDEEAICNNPFTLTAMFEEDTGSDSD